MKFSYYPGCSLTGTAGEYDRSIRTVARALALEFAELPDWNCCGASSAHMTDDQLAAGLAVRNLEIAQRRELDVVVPCAACFQRLRHADLVLRSDPALRKKTGYTKNVGIIHLTAMLSSPELVRKIRESMARPLSGLRLACYYGCLSLRTPAVTGAADYENPQGLDRIVEALGSSPVRWSHKTECCGGSLSVPRSDISRSLAADIVNAARRGGAQALVTDCPMCHANLESRQQTAAGEGGAVAAMPVFYVTELIELALTKENMSGQWRRHLIDPRALLGRFPALRLARGKG